MTPLLYRFAAFVTRDQVDVPQGDLTPSSVQTVLSIVFGFGGALSLLIIVVAGLRMVFSQGDPGAVAKSRNAVIYAIVGLVVFTLAFTIVTFVLERI